MACRYFEPEVIEQALEEYAQLYGDDGHDYWDEVYDREQRYCCDCDYFEYCELPAEKWGK